MAFILYSSSLWSFSSIPSTRPATPDGFLEL
jgi:hypothetical protein